MRVTDDGHVRPKHVVQLTLNNFVDFELCLTVSVSCYCMGQLEIVHWRRTSRFAA